jgi:RHS repeat-associated protein
LTVTTTITGGGWNSPAYDAAGNMVSGPKAGAETTRLHFVYDAWNRLVQVKADSGGQPGAVIATYQYDGRGFRTRKVLAGGETWDYYYNEEHQVVEVRKNGDTDAFEQYVWGARYIDAPVMIYRDTNTDGTVDQNLYVMQDANFNTTATLNGSTGAVQNRFTYTPYGRRTVLNSAWQAATTDVTLGHQGLSLDAETGLYYNRARMLHPTLGVFTGRDPLGYVDGGSLYEYEGGLPLARLDPIGTDWGWSDFVRHYYIGGGRTIHLQNDAIGLLDDYQNAPAVAAAVDAMKRSAIAELQRLGTDLYLRQLGSPRCLTSTTDYSHVYSGTPVDVQDAIFVMGNGVLQGSVRGSVKLNCDCSKGVAIATGFSYEATFNFWSRDEFRDPLDIGPEILGDPFTMWVSWSETVTGTK